jgi:hypothetical protein
MQQYGKLQMVFYTIMYKGVTTKCRAKRLEARDNPRG